MDRGPDFLKSQINNAVMQHQTFLRNLEDHEGQAEDPRFRDLCSRHIPRMREHQRMLEGLQQAVGAELGTGKKILGAALGLGRDVVDATRESDFLRLVGDIVTARQSQDTAYTFAEAGPMLGHAQLQQVGETLLSHHKEYVDEGNRLAVQMFVEHSRGTDPTMSASQHADVASQRSAALLCRPMATALRPPTPGTAADASDVVAVAAELLALQSPTGDEGPAVDYAARWLVRRGWSVTVQEVTPGRGNVWATRGRGEVTLSTHLDTVPPYYPPRLQGSRLYGRGSADAKGIAAAMLCAADRLAREGEERVDLLLLVGEEKGSDGARAANHLPATSRWLVNGEPTESKLASGAKGSLRVTVRTRGREAHSAYAHLGRSAIEPLVDLLPRLRALPLPNDPVLGDTTYNVGVIRGGTEANIVPAHAEAELMFRLVGDVEAVKGALRGWAGDTAELEWGSTIPAQRFHTIDGFDVAPVSYTSDIPLLSRWGTPLLFGPGSITVAHTPDEYVAVAELRESVDAYARIVRALLA